MNSLQPNTALPPSALRARALGLLPDTVVPLLNGSQDQSPVPAGRDQGDGNGEAVLWQALRCKCGELSTLLLRADDPGEAAAYVLGYLPKHLEYVFEQLFGRKRLPVMGGSGGQLATSVAARAGAALPPGAPLIVPGRAPPPAGSRPRP
jgi:hypothetical protein